MMLYSRTTKNVQQGFTLIEMLVSVAIFSVVMVMALGALLSLSTADRKAETLKSAVDNINFAIDSMSRSIRTGYNYHCGSVSGGDCSTGSNIFYFTANNGTVTGYRLESLSIDPSAGTACGQTAPKIGCIQRSTDGGSTWAAITAPDVIVQDCSGSGGCDGSSQPSYLFYVKGSALGAADYMQPTVLMTLAGSAQVSVTQTAAFHLQTSITQRIYDQ